MEFLEVFLHESKANLTIPASDLNIYCLELHYIHIALLFSPHIQMFYLKKNVIRGKFGEGACDSVNKLFFATHYSVHQLSAGEVC